MFNALTFDNDIMSRPYASRYTAVFHAGETRIDDPKVANFITGGAGLRDGDGIYLPCIMADDAVIDRAIEGVLGEKRRIIINVCSDLEEVGTCDKRYGATPVGLAHKYGLLDGAFVCGCSYVDKDDVDLIVQSGARVILTPSLTMGEGKGIPPLRMLLSLGAEVHIGTGTAEFDPEGDLGFELRLIGLAVSAALGTKYPIDKNDLKKMLNTPANIVDIRA